MNTSLKHLSPGQRDKLERVVRIIVGAIQPEKIILYGVFSAGGVDALRGDVLQGDTLRGEGLRVEALLRVLGAYDLLIVSRQGDRRSDYELQDLIENRCREEAPITALIHDIGYVNRRLAEGQYFFAMVIREGVLLYDAHRTSFVKAAATDWGQVRSLAERDFERWN